MQDVYTHRRCACPQDFDFHQIFSKWQVVGLGHFVRPSGYRYMVCPAIFPYRFGATALIFCLMFMHIMEVCMFTGFWFSSNILKMTGSWTWSFFSYQLHKGNMVCPANSSYSFRATALIFCRMFIHIMDVHVHRILIFIKYLIMTGSWTGGGHHLCLTDTHFIFKKSLLTKQLCP